MELSRDHSGTSSSVCPVFDFNRFLAVADHAARTFFDRTKPMTGFGHSSILFSDGLCICALCEMFDIDALVEAGTGCGGSTEMFARYFCDERRVRDIWSVDLAYPLWIRPLHVLRLKQRDPKVFSSRWAQRVARRRLSRFPNLKLVYGDAVLKLPIIVDELSQLRARIGIFIDGPKEHAQLALAHDLLRRSPFVRFAALDDVGPMYDASGRYARFRGSPYAAFATSDSAFFDRYTWVNAGRLPDRMIGHPEHRGYGVGVLVNNESPQTVSAICSSEVGELANW